MTTNVPFPTFSDAGLSIPSESAIRAGLEQDFQTAFGGFLNLSPATPQGQLIASISAIIGATNDLLLETVNQVDPATSSGRMQDAIARMSYLWRKPATPTTVTCTCTGANGTVIDAGATAVASDGTIYSSVGPATITGGSASIVFQATKSGPIPCPAGSLNTIYRVVPGWDTITNPADGVLGQDTETRAQFEARRVASVALNAVGILPAMRGAVLNVSGVTDAYVAENNTSSTLSVGGVTLAARSVYVAAVGGLDADVAKAIWSKKPPGCGYTGNTTVTITDSTNYAIPYPSYSVTFQRPSSLRIYAVVTLANSGLVPSNAATLIQNAMLAAFNGADGYGRARIGATLYASRFYAAIQGLGPWAQIVSLTIGTSSSPTGTEVGVNINQIPTLAAGDISVVLE